MILQEDRKSQEYCQVMASHRNVPIRLNEIDKYPDKELSRIHKIKNPHRTRLAGQNQRSMNHQAHLRPAKVVKRVVVVNPLNYYDRVISFRRPAKSSLLILSLLLFLLIKAIIVSSIVVYQIRSISSKTGRTDYALSGETVELSCHYMLKDDFEDIKSVVWSKDGVNFLRWRKKKPGLEVLSYTYKGHLDASSSHSHIILHNVTIDMHGRYKCSVRTDLNQHEQEHDLTVILSSGCRLGDWRVRSEPSECRESFSLDCKQMFPRPVPSCGLWNGRTDKFIRSVSVDITEQDNNNNNATGNDYLLDYASVAPAPDQTMHQTIDEATSKARQHQYQQINKTFRIRYREIFELSDHNNNKNNNSNNNAIVDTHQHHNQNVNRLPQHHHNPQQVPSNPNTNSLFQYAGHLVFKCDIVVPETSWKLSLQHKMFDFNDGCLADPLETIDWLRRNYSQSISARLQATGFNLLNPVYSNANTINNDNINYKSINSAQQLDPSVSAPIGYELRDAPDLTYEFRPATATAFNTPANTNYHQSSNANNNNNNNSSSNHLSLQNLMIMQQQHIAKQHSPDLNCWRKPKIGTIVQLACSNKRAKLMGAQQLECRKQGWVLLTNSVAIGSPQGQPPGNLMNKNKLISRAGRRVSLDQSNQHLRNDIALEPNAKVKSTDISTKKTTENQTQESSASRNQNLQIIDLEDDNSDITQNQQKKPATRLQTSTSNPADPEQRGSDSSNNNYNNNDNDNNNVSSSSNDDNEDSIRYQTDEFSQTINKLVSSEVPLSPSQLASLLPTCILPVKRRRPAMQTAEKKKLSQNLKSESSLEVNKLAIEDITYRHQQHSKSGSTSNNRLPVKYNLLLCSAITIIVLYTIVRL